MTRIERITRRNKNVARRWMVRAGIYRPQENAHRKQFLANAVRDRKKDARFPLALCAFSVACRVERTKLPPDPEEVEARLAINRSASRSRARAQYYKDPKAAYAKARAWFKNRPDKVREYRQKYKPRMRAYVKRRMREDPAFRITHRLRDRLKEFLWERKTHIGPSNRLFVCTPQELKTHLESQFAEWMTWENYGTLWHIDHRKPCAAFNLLDAGEQRACFHFTNLQPLSAVENMKKGARFQCAEAA